MEARETHHAAEQALLNDLVPVLAKHGIAPDNACWKFIEEGVPAVVREHLWRSLAPEVLLGGKF